MRRGTVGIAGAAAGLAALEAHDRRQVARDPVAPRLFEAPAGEEHQVVSADGTRLHVEAYGPADAPAVVLVHDWVAGHRSAP